MVWLTLNLRDSSWPMGKFVGVDVEIEAESMMMMMILSL